MPFAIGAAFALFGLYLRRNLDETESFLKASREKRGNLLVELLRHPKQVLIVFGLTMGGTTAFYTYTTYMPTFLVNTVKLTRDQATQISFITLVIFAVDPAAVRCAVRPDRPPPGADLVRHHGHAGHGSVVDRARRHA